MMNDEPDSFVADPPYPWFGGKTKIAPIVWERFGDVPNYIEPFFGGGAVWRLRPHWPFSPEPIRRETINDYDGHVSNFWRAVHADPEAVAEHLDWPVSELDLHARGDWLFRSPEAPEFVERMRADRKFYDVERAGVWCWFVCSWIGRLPGVGEANENCTEDAVHRTRPHLGNAGKGVNRQLPHLRDAGKGVNRQLPHLRDAGKGVCEQARADRVDWMRALCDRLRYVRVCCGDWSRVCGPSVTWNNATPCGVFFDPPYSAEAGRDNELYSEECGKVAHDCRAWAIENGKIEGMRICLAGYEGEGHDELVERHGWSVVAWKTAGGYANLGKKAGLAGRDNAHRERLWFSPACLSPQAKQVERGLFDGLEE